VKQFDIRDIPAQYKFLFCKEKTTVVNIQHYRIERCKIIRITKTSSGLVYKVTSYVFNSKRESKCLTGIHFINGIYFLLSFMFQLKQSRALTPSVNSLSVDPNSMATYLTRSDREVFQGMLCILYTGLN